MRIKAILCFLVCLITISSMGQAPFRGNSIIVARIGDGVSPLSSRGFPVYLDEYSISGTLIQSIKLPITGLAGSDTAKKFVLPPREIQYGTLALSSNKQYLTIGGVNAIPSTTLANMGNSEKTIARVDFNSKINTSTGVPVAEASNIPICAISNDGSNFWLGNTATGVTYSILGSSNSTSISPDDVSSFNIIGGQLYVTFVNGRIGTLGSGLPTTGPATVSFLPGIDGDQSFSGFHSNAFFADLDAGTPGYDVIYVSQDGDYSLSKFSLVGSTWVLNGTVGINSDDYHSLTGVVNGASVTLYATRKVGVATASGGELVTITDISGYNNTFSGTPSVLATAGANTVFRGVALAPQPLSVSLATKAFLQGAYNPGLGRHKNVTTAWANTLNAGALNQPYNVAPFNYAGTESVTNGFFTADDGVTTDIIDWVLVELHDATTPSIIIARKACFINEEGKIVDLDKVSNPTFTGVGANNYYVVIKHRNHLPIRSSSTVFINGATPVLYDFTTAQSQAFQDPGFPINPINPAMKDLGAGVFGMFAGNANSNTNIRFTGLNNDAGVILNVLSGNQAGTASGYNTADLNLDGITRYTGLNNDAGILLTALGGNQSVVFGQHQ